MLLPFWACVQSLMKLVSSQVGYCTPPLLVTRVPIPKSQFTRGQSVQSQPLRAWKLGLTTSHGSQVVSLKYDMDAYMATLFGGEAQDLCYDSGLAFLLELGQAKS